MNLNFIKEVLLQLNINDKIVSIDQVAGGLLHKLYKVQLKSGKAYAVKCLNPRIMERKTALTNMVNSEMIASALKGEIPAIAALVQDNRQVHQIEGQFFMVFDWIEGKSIFSPDIKACHCAEIGKLLGKIHNRQIIIAELEKENEDNQEYDWAYYLKIAQKQEVKWLAKFEAVFESLIQYHALIMNAKSALINNMVISHRDLDPKNVLWNGDQAFIIDWEAAGWINPYQELVEVINYWADDGQGGIRKDYFTALINAYKQYVCLDDVNWEEVLVCSYDGMLGWLAYNVRRALGLEASDEEEVTLGEEQVLTTIKELQKHASKVACLQKWLSE